MLLLAALCVVAVAYVPFQVMGNFTQSFSFGGGIPGCSNCGAATAYACSVSLSTGKTIGHWNNGTVSLKDQVPNGMKALSVTLNILGAYMCDQTAGGSNSIVTLTLQSETYLTRTLAGSTTCACGTCDGARNFCGRNILGLQDYQYGGVNPVTIALPSSSPSICVHSADVTIAYGYPAQFASNEFFLSGKPKVCDYNSQSCYQSYCLTSSPNNYNQLELQFQDPVPANWIVIQVNVTTYGYACMTDSQYLSTPLSYNSFCFGLQTQTVGCVTNWTSADVDPNACAYPFFSKWNDNTAWSCDSITATSRTYQTGWPNYVYGGTNTVYGRWAQLPQDATDIMCSTRLEVALTAYNPSSKAHKKIFISDY